MIGFTRVVILMLSSYFSCVYKNNNILKLFCRITMAISHMHPPYSRVASATWPHVKRTLIHITTTWRHWNCYVMRFTSITWLAYVEFTTCDARLRRMKKDVHWSERLNNWLWRCDFYKLGSATWPRLTPHGWSVCRANLLLPFCQMGTVFTIKFSKMYLVLHTIIFSTQ